MGAGQVLERGLARLKALWLSRCIYLDDAPRSLLGGRLVHRLPFLSVIILARRHYYETLQDYPINNRLELRRALTLAPPDGPFRGLRLYQARPLPEGGHRVIQWTLRDALTLPKREGGFQLLVPETALLRRGQADGLWCYGGAHGTLVLRLKDNDPQSLLVPEGQSTLLARAAQSLGEAPETLRSRPPEPLKASLLKAATRLTLADLSAFLRFSPRVRAPFPWKQASVLAVGLVTVYLGIISLFLSARGLYLEQALDAQAPEVQALFNLEAEARDAEDALAALQQAAQTPAPAWAGWPVIVEMLKAGTILRNLSFEDNQFTVYGVAPSATRMLEIAMRHPQVRDAAFARPVRQLPGGEQFAIAFTPTAEGLSRE